MSIAEEIVLRMPEFAKADSNYQETAVRVGKFLKKGAARHDRLRDLEGAMVDEINSRLAKGEDPPLDEERAGRAATLLSNRVGQPKLPEYLQHVLTTVLSKNEKDLGFNLYSRTGD